MSLGQLPCEIPGSDKQFFLSCINNFHLLSPESPFSPFFPPKVTLGFGQTSFTSHSKVVFFVFLGFFLYCVQYVDGEGIFTVGTSQIGVDFKGLDVRGKKHLL